MSYARSDVIRRRLLVVGRVQGVNFRAECAREARHLGLEGQVKNLPDGRVEVVAEGPRAMVGRLVAWCSVGPPHARVDGVEVIEEEPLGESGFRIAG